MSGSNNEISNTGGPASSAEPSMEEILASIRRILKDDQAGTQPEEAEEEILVLDSTMVVKPSGEPSRPSETLSPEEPSIDFSLSEPITGESMQDADLVSPGLQDESESEPHIGSAATFDLPTSQTNKADVPGLDIPVDLPPAYHAMEEPNMSDHARENVQPPDGLMSDAASDAAAGSIGALIRSISSDRQIAVGRAGLTLEDLVREELRPLLKSWLDTNLAALVERIVRAEIQRVIERSGT